MPSRQNAFVMRCAPPVSRSGSTRASFAGGDAWDRQIRKQIHDCALFELYRRQIAKGLDGDEREVLKARVFLREWFTGKIRMMPLAGRPRSALERTFFGPDSEPQGPLVAGAGFVF